MISIDSRDVLSAESLIQKESLTLDERETLSQYAKNLLSHAALVNTPRLSSLIGRVKKRLETFTITEEDLLTTYDFWGCLSKQGVKKLVIQTKEGLIAYDPPVLRALQILKPELEDLTEKITLKFLDGRVIETKAKLRLCGDMFKELFAGAIVRNIPLNCTKESFSSIQNAVDLADYLKPDFPVADKNISIAKYLLFPPQATLSLYPHIFGQDHFEKFWGKIDPVPSLPQELLTFLNEPCPIRKDGCKVIDTHKVFWIPKTVDGQPLTMNRIQEIAKSDKFGAIKVEYADHSKAIQKQMGDLPIEGGYWVALGPPLEETSDLRYTQQCEILKNKYPGYGVMSAGHAIISSLAPFAASGEITLSREPLRHTVCSENIEGWQVCLGGLLPSGLCLSFGWGGRTLLVLPLRKFSETQIRSYL